MPENKETTNEMEMPQFPSYIKDNKKKDTIVMIIAVVAMLVCLGSVMYSNIKVSAMADKVLERDSWELVLDAETGRSLLANKEEITPALRAEEYKAVAKAFFTNMYGFDRYTYESNMIKGVKLAPEEGKPIYLAYEKATIYHKMVNEGLRLDALVDSITVVESSMDKMNGFLFGKQHVIKPNGEGVYKYVFKFEVKDVGRSLKNLNGANVVQWEQVQRAALSKEELKDY